MGVQAGRFLLVVNICGHGFAPVLPASKTMQNTSRPWPGGMESFICSARLLNVSGARRDMKAARVDPRGTTSRMQATTNTCAAVMYGCSTLWWCAVAMLSDVDQHSQN